MLEKYTKVMSKRSHIAALIGIAALALSNPRAVRCAEPTAPTAIDWEYQIFHQRGVEAVTWAIPAVSMLRFRDAYFSLGGGYDTVYYLSKPPTAQTEALTANNQTPYATLLLTTKDGPVVLGVIEGGCDIKLTVIRAAVVIVAMVVTPWEALAQRAAVGTRRGAAVVGPSGAAGKRTSSAAVTGPYGAAAVTGPYGAVGVRRGAAAVRR